MTEQAHESEQDDQRHTPQSFHSLNLSGGVLNYVDSQKYTRMTPVQAATIPLFLANKDVAVQAVTGSGKTLAFLIPMVEIIIKSKRKKQQVAAIVLSPTRELAQQTHQVAQDLCRACALPEPLLLVGGSTSNNSNGLSCRPVTADLVTFQQTGADLWIGTPGRVQDFLKYNIDCSELECLVLDEADVLLNMGFAQTLQQILAKLPKMRRTGLFSATTASESLKEWMHRVGMRNPVWIDVAVTRKTEKQATPSTLTNYYMVTPLDEKLSRLAAFLEDHRNEKIIVFFLTCACVEFFGAALKQILSDVNIELLHGKLVQKRRENALMRFKNRGSDDGPTGGALFCTDVAARGLDVTDIDWVIQFDAPQDPAFFVHRAGRTARAGRHGKSLIMLTRKEEAYVDFLQMRKVPLTSIENSERCCPPTLVEGDNDEARSTEKRAEFTKKPKGNDCRIIRSAAGSDMFIEDVLPKVRDLIIADRDLLEKGTKAFTSFIRAYKEHQCSFILRFASLDLGLLATSFCLLRLPKMPELKEILLKHKGKLPRFTPAGPEVDIFAIPFRDKVREDARQKRLQIELAAGGKSAKQIKKERKEAEIARKAKGKRDATISKGRNPEKKRGKQAQLVDEWDDLAKEERLFKKLRRGKITQEQFDEQLKDST